MQKRLGVRGDTGRLTPGSLSLVGCAGLQQDAELHEEYCVQRWTSQVMGWVRRNYRDFRQGLSSQCLGPRPEPARRV